MWNNKFELPVEPYSAPDVQDCFEYIIKKYETLTDVKTVYYLELLTPGIIKLFQITKNKITNIKKL